VSVRGDLEPRPEMVLARTRVGPRQRMKETRLRHASGMTTLNTYGHMWPDADESSRAAVAVVLAARKDSSRTEKVAD